MKKIEFEIPDDLKERLRKAFWDEFKHHEDGDGHSTRHEGEKVNTR